ncbi:hypothetical protein FVI60_08810 [Campylobacter jejuni]|nr:hypothetical protein [Campylobacter jejuni]
MAGRKKKSSVEHDTKTLAKEFFNAKTWGRKDVSTHIANKRFGISQTRVFRILKALGVEYQNKPYSDGLPVEEKTQYLLKNLKLAEFIGFYAWYEDVKNTKAPLKGEYNLSMEGRIKILERHVKKKERNKELMAKLNGMSDTDIKKVKNNLKSDIPMISEMEKAKLSAMSLTEFSKSIATEVYESLATDRQKSKFTEETLAEAKLTRLYAEGKATRTKDDLRVVAAKCLFYRDVKKLVDTDFIVKGQSKNTQPPVNVFDRAYKNKLKRIARVQKDGAR